MLSVPGHVTVVLVVQVRGVKSWVPRCAGCRRDFDVTAAGSHVVCEIAGVVFVVDGEQRADASVRMALGNDPPA